MNNNKKAIVLFSGGLDSLLSALIIRTNGIEPICLNCTGPFSTKSKRDYIGETAQKFNLKLIRKDIGKEMLETVKSPKFGYGKNINPCIDCKILMLKKAGDLMKELGADFVVTGEVLGQRPMSQQSKSLNLIENESGLKGFIVRPLSAAVLNDTVPQQNGLIKKENLYSVVGRSRKKQFELAQEFGINEKDYSSPAGGCLLTMKEYSLKLRDLLKFKKNAGIEDVLLLKTGRHFRINPDFKVIVGRDEPENNLLDSAAKGKMIRMWAENCKGPTVLGDGPENTVNIEAMAGLCGRYSDCIKSEKADFAYEIRGETGRISAVPFDDSGIIKYKI